MFRAFRSARGSVARLALAAALVGGVAFAGASAPAYAQNSRGFATAFGPVAAMVQPETADYEGARAAIPGLLAAVENEDDQMIAGNLILNIGNNLSDTHLQRQGLEMMVQSGRVTPEQLPLFNYFIGNLAYNEQDYQASRDAIAAAQAAGYVDSDDDPFNDPEYIILQSYLAEDNSAAGIEYMINRATEMLAAGQQVPEAWLLTTLQESYDMDLGPQAVQVSTVLLNAYESQENWINALQVVNALYELSPQARVDLARLFIDTGAMTQRSEYIRLIEDLDPRIMSNEVQDVLQAGLEAGQFTSTDEYYVEVKGIADARAPQDVAGIEGMVSDGRSGDAMDAMSAADVLFSIEDYARAAEFYQIALDRGGDRDTALTRLGMSQARAGDYAAAQATLAQVGGERAAVAQMWALYAALQAN